MVCTQPRVFSRSDSVLSAGSALQESLKQVRSCCNRTDPDWSALLSQRLQSLESDLEGRLQGFADTIKHGASLSICQRTVVGAECTGDRYV